MGHNASMASKHMIFSTQHHEGRKRGTLMKHDQERSGGRGGDREQNKSKTSRGALCCFHYH